jgi:hypothetical protein
VAIPPTEFLRIGQIPLYGSVTDSIASLQQSQAGPLRLILDLRDVNSSYLIVELDTDRDMLPTKIQKLATPDGGVLTDWEATEFQRTGDRWFPKRIVRKSYFLREGLPDTPDNYLLWHTDWYEITHVTFNGQLDGVRFRPEFPLGVRIDDRIRLKTYTHGGKEGEEFSARKASIEAAGRLQKLEPLQPAIPPSARPSHSLAWSISLALVGFSFLAYAWWLYCRRRSV